MATASTVKVVLDLAPVVGEVRITRKDQILFGWVIEDDDGPIDFTGDAFLLTVNTKSDGSGTERFSIGEDNTLDTTGTVLFKPTIANLTLAPATEFFDVEWTTAGGDVRTVIKGEFIICEDITNP